MKILQIEDNEAIIDSFGTILNFLGHEYESTMDGRKGVKMITEGKYDLIFLDLTMPEFSGIDVLHELLNYHHSGKVVVITANELESSQVNELFELEVHSIMQKPISLESFSRLLKSFEPSEISKQVSTLTQ